MVQPVGRLEIAPPTSLAKRAVVAMAAYRAGERLHDEKQGRTYDYSGKGDIELSEIIAPDGAAERIHDRSWLWNRAIMDELLDR